MRKLQLPMAILLLLTIGVGPLMVPQTASAAGAVIYVDVNVSGGLDNGNSWANAFDTLQEGLDAANPDDEIWVAQGTYKPTVEHGGTGDRFQSFQMMNGVEVYGGFIGTETQRGERDWENNRTTLSGDIGTGGDSSDNCYHVFFHPNATNLDNTAVLDGFTVTAGNADSVSSPHLYGGGMYNHSSSPSINNCSFSGNSALFGGGMNNERSSPSVSNCSFSGNSGNFGCGMSNYWSSPSLTNCSFSGNSAVSDGGGMWGNNSTPTLINCSFSGNSAERGGGMFNEISSSPSLTNCILWGDNASGLDNEVYNDGVSSSTFFFCDIEGSGGSTGWDSGLGTDGGSNIDADPLFVAQPDSGSAPTTGGDLHLRTGSPCIDSGNNAAVAGISTDFEGDNRIIDGDMDGTGTVDIGVDEYFIPVPVGAEAYPLNTASLLAPWFGLLAVIAGITFILRRRRVHC